MADRDCRPTTLRAVIKAIESDESLTKGQKTNLTTGIKTFCRCVGRDPSQISADPAALRAMARLAKPKLLGIGDAHFKNSMSRLRKALEHVGIAVDRRRNIPLSSAWEALLSGVMEAKRVDLRKLAGRCSALGIEPRAVTQDVFDSYYEFLEEQSIQHNVRERWHRSRRAWNDAVAAEGSGYPYIENPFERREKLPSLAEFPASFAAQLQDYCDALAKPTIFRAQDAALADSTSRRSDFTKRLSGRRRKPLSRVTADNYARNLLLLAGYLIRDGVPVEHFTSLASLLDPDLVMRGLERMQTDILAERNQGRSRFSACCGEAPHRDPNEPLPIITAVAHAVLSLAKFVGPDAETFTAIKTIASSARVKREGMTPKNKARLNQLADPRAKSLLLNLPAIVFAGYADVTKPTFKQAREVQDAAILAVLLELPIRIKNVAQLDLERHFLRPVGEGPSKWLVSIPGHEVKNGQDIDGELSEETSAMLDAYVKVFRPLLCDKPSSSLFVSSTGRAKRTTTYATQFKQFIYRETGLVMNPHLMRHLAANRVIDADPRDAEVARQLLGHRSIDTTRKFYVDSSHQRRALKAYQDLNRRDRAEAGTFSKPCFDFGRRQRRAPK